MNTDLLDRVIDRVDDVSNVSQTAVKVSKMLDQVDVSFDELADIITLDQFLTLQILKLCNSAAYGFSKRILTVQEAIAKLGVKTLKRLVFIALSHGVLNKSIKGYSLEGPDLWRNSLSCAVYARKIAETVGYHNPDVAFVAGLLRDVGKLVMDQYVEVNYESILDYIESNHVSFAQAEEGVIGFNHCQIGSRLLEKWRFPELLSEVVKHHHSIKEAQNEKSLLDIKLTAIIHIADAVTTMLTPGGSNDGLMYKLDTEALEVLGIDEDNRSFNFETLIGDLTNLNEEINMMVGSFK